VYGRLPPLGSQEGYLSSLPAEAKIGGLKIIGRLTAQAAVAEAELESAEAELEKAKTRARVSVLGAHGQTWGTDADDHLD
jgi:hypothetical protein